MSAYLDRTEAVVLEVLVDRSPLHVIEIASSVDYHPVTVDQTCAHLHDEGYIYPLGRGLFEVTEDGKRRVAARRES